MAASQDERAVWLAPPPPPAVLRAANVLTRPLLASRLGRRMQGVMLLEVRGRRTGRRIRVPVNVHNVDGVVMAFTDAAWRHNFTGGAEVRVTCLGRVHDTRGTLIAMSPQEMGWAVRKSLDAGGSAKRMGIRSVAGHDPTAQELAELGPALGTSVIKLDLTPADLDN